MLLSVTTLPWELALEMMMRRWQPIPAEGQSLLGCRSGETTRDVAILHNEQFFAAAQKKYVYIYDKRGLEVHCLKVIDGLQITVLSIPG